MAQDSSNLINEYGVKLIVNGYLDTGLFLDHKITRRRGEMAGGKDYLTCLLTQAVLLFCVWVALALQRLLICRTRMSGREHGTERPCWSSTPICSS